MHVSTQRNNGGAEKQTQRGESQMEIIPWRYRRERDRNRVERVLNHVICGAAALWVGFGLCRSNLEINQAGTQDDYKCVQLSIKQSDMKKDEGSKQVD